MIELQLLLIEWQVARLPKCAASLLMGCSSGRLREHGGEFEPTGKATPSCAVVSAVAGAPLAYLAAGCPCLVANLWDVTDRDIDRFCKEVVTRCDNASEGAICS